MSSIVPNIRHLSEGRELGATLRSSAQEFEAMLITELVKSADEMRQSSEAGMDGYNDMRNQAMASALAARGGVGIAKLLLNQLHAPSTAQIKVLSDSADHIIAGKNRKEEGHEN